MEIMKFEGGNENKWKYLSNICIEAGKSELGTIKRNLNKLENPEIRKLSTEQKNLRDVINNTKDREIRRELQEERNNLIKKIHRLLEEEKEKVLEGKIEEIENSKNDSNKMFKVIKQIQNSKPKKKLLVNSEEGMVTEESKQAELITKHFQKMFAPDTIEEMQNIQPQEMKIPFSRDEISKAAKSLKNNKSAGKDNLQPELIKYAPHEIHSEIANILNEAARTGIHPKEIKEGILIPLQKPGKPQGPPENLRPIILLCIIRKILAICMIRRCWKKFKALIETSQAAY